MVDSEGRIRLIDSGIVHGIFRDAEAANSQALNVSAAGRERITT
jgi:hypothetical protein